VKLRLLIVLAALFGIGECARDHFTNYIDASATYKKDPLGSLIGSPYYATLHVHMDHPVTVTCDIKALTEDGTVAATASFTVENADGEVEHDGDLSVISESKVNEDLDIQCQPVE
jgi:hypothetical protein